MEAIAGPLNWSNLSEEARSLFRALRSKYGGSATKREMADDVLQVPDPNGRWLELKAAPENWMCCDFVVEPKIGVDDWKLSSSPRTDRE
jgi:hypothetical protein